MLAVVSLPPAASLERTNAAMSALTRIAREVPGVDGVVYISGFNLLTGQATLTEEVSRTQHRDDRFAAGFGQHRELHAAFLEVQDAVTDIALSEDHLASPIRDNPFRESRRIEKRLNIERRLRFRFHGQPPSNLLDRGQGLDTPRDGRTDAAGE